MTQPVFRNPVDGPRIVPRGEDRRPEDKLPNGRDAFRVTSTQAEHLASGRTAGTDVGNYKGGDPVRAMAAGRVTFVEPTREGIVRIDHGSGWSSGYAHMDGITVAVGQEVAAGHPIGKVGKRGTREVHLHFDIRLNDRPLDAWSLLAQNAVGPDFLALGTLVVAGARAGGINLRKEPHVEAAHYHIDTDAVFDLLGYKPNGGPWTVGGESGHGWYRIRRQELWWVYEAGAKDIALSELGQRLFPSVDCTAQDNKLAAARTALAGIRQSHDATTSALDALVASITED